MIDHRWNIEETPTGLRICRGNHKRHGECEWEEFVPRRHLLTLWTWGRHTLDQHNYDEIRPFAESDATEENCSAIVKEKIAAMPSNDEIATMALILQKIAYPRRGTDEERYGINDVAPIIQTAFANERLEELQDQKTFGETNRKQGEAGEA